MFLPYLVCYLVFIFLPFIFPGILFYIIKPLVSLSELDQKERERRETPEVFKHLIKTDKEFVSFIMKDTDFRRRVWCWYADEEFCTFEDFLKKHCEFSSIQEMQKALAPKEDKALKKSFAERYLKKIKTPSKKLEGHYLKA